MTGVLKGFDQLLNLVLDECLEYLRDPDDPLKITDETRSLGLIVCGTSVMVVSGLDAWRRSRILSWPRRTAGP